MPEIDDLLTSIGLSDKEASMYIVLLRHGTQPTSLLAKKAGMNRGTAYVILHSLLEKGLVVKTTRRKIQCFGPLDPKQLAIYLKHQEQQLQTNQQRVQAMMGQLTAITNPLTAKPKIEFFDGVEGARFVLDQTLTSQDKILRAFLSIADIAEFVGSEFFDDYTSRRIRSGHSLHAIRTREKDRQALAVDAHAKRYISSKRERREIRHTSEDLAFPITMYMFDAKLAIISSKEEGFALIIESKEFCDMQKKLFALVWASLPRKRKNK